LSSRCLIGGANVLFSYVRNFSLRATGVVNSLGSAAVCHF
jgi:hypothetical protein